MSIARITKVQKKNKIIRQEADNSIKPQDTDKKSNS